MLWFGAHSSVSSFCLSSCVYLYVLGKKATYLSLKEVIFYRSCSVWPRSTISCDHKARHSVGAPHVSCMHPQAVIRLWLLHRNSEVQGTHLAQLWSGHCVGRETEKLLACSSCSLISVWWVRVQGTCPAWVQLISCARRGARGSQQALLQLGLCVGWPRIRPLTKLQLSVMQCRQDTGCLFKLITVWDGQSMSSSAGRLEGGHHKLCPSVLSPVN